MFSLVCLEKFTWIFKVDFLVISVNSIRSISVLISIKDRYN